MTTTGGDNNSKAMRLGIAINPLKVSEMLHTLSLIHIWMLKPFFTKPFHRPHAHDCHIAIRYDEQHVFWTRLFAIFLPLFIFSSLSLAFRQFHWVALSLNLSVIFYSLRGWMRHSLSKKGFSDWITNLFRYGGLHYECSHLISIYRRRAYACFLFVEILYFGAVAGFYCRNCRYVCRYQSTAE